jgi:secondary thiamine-phosphate synthase enzyme
MIHQADINVSTSGHGDMHDLSDRVAAIVAQSGIRAGLVNIFNVGSTAAVGIIEFEPGLRQDLPRALDKLFPPSREYAHEQTWHDGNGHSHLQATLLGQSLTVPVREGRPVLGTWQQIFHIECDIHARQRQVVVTVQGEG